MARSSEPAVLKKLNTPAKIQTFISRLRWNFEPNGDTCRSVTRALRAKEAHCIEAALIAAAALSISGERPLIMDLKAADHDFDHVVALFKRNGKWGAISKSNHVYLRYRDPIYRTLRELALSYFHEYFDTRGRKTLLSYSRALDLSTMGRGWIDDGDAWRVAERLDEIRHYPLTTKKERADLRPLERYEQRSYSLPEYQKRR